MNIFKAYDVRGIYPTELNEGAAYKIGRAAVAFLKCKNIVVGMDMRKSGPKLFEALVKGITEQGCNVIDIGLCTTPMLHVSVPMYGYDAGIMISASHNPSEYNGFKIDGKSGIQLSEETGLKEIEKLFNENKFKDEKKGKIIKKGVLKDYVKHVLNFSENIKGLKVIVDYGNGVGAISAKPVFEKLDIKVIPMYEIPDDSFPNHVPNPHDIENFRDLQEMVKKEKADLGVFFDGDADRASFVDEKGAVILSDYIYCMLIEEVLKENPGEKVYTDIRFGWAVKETIEKNNGISIVVKSGNPFFKDKLFREGGAIASEASGHIIFKENYCIDDGIFSLVEVLNIVCKKQKPISEIMKPFKKYHKTEEINLKVEDKDAKIKEIEGLFSSGKITKIDGITVEYKDWWFNLRKSNTEPLLRLNLEAKTKQKMQEMRDKLVELINK